MTIKERIIELWLWAVAVAFTVAIVLTVMAWVVGAAFLLLRWLNG